MLLQQEHRKRRHKENLCNLRRAMGAYSIRVDSIEDWLDDTVHDGYGSSYGPVFRNEGVNDTEQLSRIKSQTISSILSDIQDKAARKAIRSVIGEILRSGANKFDGHAATAAAAAAAAAAAPPASPPLVHIPGGKAGAANRSAADHVVFRSPRPRKRAVVRGRTRTGVTNRRRRRQPLPPVVVVVVVVVLLLLHPLLPSFSTRRRCWRARPLRRGSWS